MKKYILLSVMLLTSGMNIISMEPKKLCDICFEDKSTYDFKTLSCCTYDSSCTDCLLDLIDTSLQEQTIAHINCPNRNCTQSITEQDIRFITQINPEIYKKFCDVATHQCINNIKNVKRCPTPDCPFAFESENKQSFTCPSCKHVYCSECLIQHASEMTCKQAYEHKKLIGDINKAEIANNEWVQNNTKACPHCKASVEKNKGCNHMTCKCQHQFCWLCLARWKTCNCPQFPAAHNNIIEQVNNNNGINAFYMAARQGHTEVVRALIAQAQNNQAQPALGPVTFIYEVNETNRNHHYGFIAEDDLYS